MSIPFSYTKPFDTSLHTLEGAQSLFLKGINKLLQEEKATRPLLEANIILSSAAQLKDSGLTNFHANITVSPLDIQQGEVTEITSPSEAASLVKEAKTITETHLAFVKGIGSTEHHSPFNTSYGGYTQTITIQVECEVQGRSDFFSGPEINRRWQKDIVLRRIQQNYFQCQYVNHQTLPPYMTQRTRQGNITSLF